MSNKPVVSRHRFQAELSQLLVSTTNLRVLLESISQLIAHQTDSAYVSFFIFSDETHSVSGGTKGHADVPKADARAINLYLGADRRATLAIERPSEDRLRRLMVSHHMSVVVPLYRRDSLLGYIFVGTIMAPRELRRISTLLDSASAEISIAIQNAVSLHALRELNATLQQRITNATHELQVSNQQLQRLDAAKDEFVSMASHQLRTPLTSVKGYISMVLEGDAGKVSDMQRQLLEQAFVSSERMVRLIGDFLNVSRLQTGKFVIDAHPVDLAKVVSQELRGLETTAQARGMTFHFTPPPHFPTVSLDEDKIRQVIMNFCDNALFYSKEGSKITVKLEAQKRSVTFRVTDTGIGVPAGEQDGLFTKFFRASNAKKQRPDGTGVGLFLAKKVVDAHGGEIVFKSVEGKGSTFGFTLPLA